MKIFIAGGTGAVGRPLLAELLAKEHTLVTLNRSQEYEHDRFTIALIFIIEFDVP